MERSCYFWTSNNSSEVEINLLPMPKKRESWIEHEKSNPRLYNILQEYHVESRESRSTSVEAFSNHETRLWLYCKSTKLGYLRLYLFSWKDPFSNNR